MSTIIAEEIIKQIDRLPDDQQMKVLDFVRSLPIGRYVGVPGETLIRFAGLIPVDDLDRMEQAIEEGCETVDLNEW